MHTAQLISFNFSAIFFRSSSDSFSACQMFPNSSGSRSYSQTAVDGFSILKRFSSFAQKQPDSQII